MKRDCREVVNNLIDIVEDNLPESQKKIIQNHVASCPRCNRLVQRFACVWKELSTAEKLTPSERFWPGLWAKIEDSEKSPPLREKIITGLKNSLRPAAVSLIFLLGGLFGYHLGNLPHTETPSFEVLYMEQYVQDFQDFPEGSVSDFYMQYEIENQLEVP
jgi:hypothetical protein